MNLPSSFKPMLASPLKDGQLPSFPCLASPKFDGVRAMVFGGVVYSRNLKPIPNAYIQRMLGVAGLDGVDGELIVGSATDPAAYRTTVSGVMSTDGEPPAIFYVFDIYDPAGFQTRFRMLEQRVAAHRKSSGPRSCRVQLVPQRRIENEEELREYEAECLELGYEGIMVRSLGGLYKYGRSTVKEGYLLKVKRFCDAEAVIRAAEELEHNENEATRDELGRTKRTTHKAGKTKGGTLGNLLVTGVAGSPFAGVDFSIGSGFDDDTRAALWSARSTLPGKLVKFRYFPLGSKVAPRFPVFLGFRDPIDIGGA